MLEEKDQDQILEYFKEKIDGDMAKFHLSRIYYMAKDQGEQDQKRDNLIEKAQIKSYQITRDLIIDENNAIFEIKDKNDKKYTRVVINGSRSSNGYYTLEQGLLGWICEKQNCSDVAWHLFKMLDMK